MPCIWQMDWFIYHMGLFPWMRGKKNFKWWEKICFLTRCGQNMSPRQSTLDLLLDIACTSFTWARAAILVPSCGFNFEPNAVKDRWIRRRTDPAGSLVQRHVVIQLLWIIISIYSSRCSFSNHNFLTDYICCHVTMTVVWYARVVISPLQLPILLPYRILMIWFYDFYLVHRITQRCWLCVQWELTKPSRVSTGMSETKYKMLPVVATTFKVFYRALLLTYYQLLQLPVIPAVILVLLLLLLLMMMMMMMMMMMPRQTSDVFVFLVDEGCIGRLPYAQVRQSPDFMIEINISPWVVVHVCILEWLFRLANDMNEWDGVCTLSR